LRYSRRRSHLTEFEVTRHEIIAEKRPFPLADYFQEGALLITYESDVKQDLSAQQAAI
jgi:hypothetical protein